MMLTYADWCALVLRHLNRMEEGEFLTDDESVNANRAYNAGDLPRTYALRVAADRDYQAAKWSGDLWR